MSGVRYLSNRLLFWLPPVLAAGCALYAWILAGVLGISTPQRAALSLLVASLFILTWYVLSRQISGLSGKTIVESRRHTLITLVPFVVFPLAAPYLNHRVFSSYFTGGPSQGRLAAITLFLLLLATGGSLCLALVLYWKGCDGVLAALERRATRILWVGVAVYFIVFCALAFLAYSQYRYHSDLAQYSQTLWATLRGDFFYSSVEETSGSFLSTHVSPFLLVLLPVYALKQSPLTILLLRSLALALSAVPLFYCVRRLTNSPVAGLLLSGAFLLHPEIVSQHFTAGYEVVFVAPFFFAAFYFLMEKRFRPFIFFLVMMLMVREDFVPAAFIFAIYSLIKRMPRKWAIAPLMIGIAWQVVVTLIFNATVEHWVFNLYYGHFGESPAEMVRTVLTDPVFALDETWTLHRSYLYNLLMPVGFILPWTSLVSIFAIPNMAAFLARSGNVTAATGGITHYSVLVVSALWLGLAGFISRSQKWVREENQNRSAVAISVVILVLVLSAAHLWGYRLPTGTPVDAAALDRAVGLIPEGASVSSNDGRVFPRLSTRYGLYEPLIWDVIEEPDRLPQGTDQLKKGEYVILKPFGHPVYDDEEVFAFVAEPGFHYRLIFDENGIKVYQKMD